MLAIGEAEPKVKYPRVVASVGDSPPQYVNWEEEFDLDEESPPADWLGEALQYGEAVLDVESGLSPCGDGALVPWIRRHVSTDTAAVAGDLASQRTYAVTTLRRLPDGTSTLTTELVPGQYLDSWLNGVFGEKGVRLLSVEVV